MMFRRFLNRDTMNDTPTTSTDTTDDAAARKGPPGFAPILLPRDTSDGPMPMHMRIWRYSPGLELLATVDGAAWLRLDYITDRNPHPNPNVPMLVTQASGAHVTIAGPIAAADNTLSRAWTAALADPIAIEVWSSRPIVGGSLNAGGRTHVYGVLPLLHADRETQQACPTYSAGARPWPAYRFRAEPGNAWGAGPMPIRYSFETRRPEHMHPLPERAMWLTMTTDMPPVEALALAVETEQGVHRGDQ